MSACACCSSRRASTPRRCWRRPGSRPSEREAADKLQKLILEELHHRIKNTLATVSAIASQSLRTADQHRARPAGDREPAAGAGPRARSADAGAAGRAPAWRISSRARPSPMTARARASSRSTGPDLQITSGAVIALAMTFNELCTNTTKFGALSVPAGRIEIAWTDRRRSNDRLHLTWTEKDGPAVHAPTRRSFGTRLIETLGKQLNGKVELDLRRRTGSSMPWTFPSLPQTAGLS